MDDDPSIASIVSAVLSAEFDVHSCSNADDATDWASGNTPDVVVLDFDLGSRSPTNGLELFAKLRSILSTHTVAYVMMTGVDGETVGQRFLAAGGDDFIRKPFATPEILTRTRAALERRGLLKGLRLVDESVRNELRELVRRESNDFDVSMGSSLIGNSPAMQQLRADVLKVARTKVPVLVLGETGTGKSLLAAEIHRHGGRRTGKLVTVNCANLQKELFESELFGHVKGAFTGATNDRRGLMAVADKGTLFLDEIGEVEFGVQAKLLRAIAEQRFLPVGQSDEASANVRFVCATNQDLTLAIRDGRFREDLYYRINVFPLTLPPLRKRKEDIPLLVDHFLRSGLMVETVGTVIDGVSAEAFGCLQDHDWPGNVRELFDTLASAAIRADSSKQIEVEHLRFDAQRRTRETETAIEIIYNEFVRGVRQLKAVDVRRMKLELGDTQFVALVDRALDDCGGDGDKFWEVCSRFGIFEEVDASERNKVWSSFRGLYYTARRRSLKKATAAFNRN